MNRTQRIDFYSARIEQFQIELNALKQQKIQLGWLRLIGFSCIPISTVMLYPSVLAWLAGLVFLALFLFLVARFTDVEQKMDFVSRLIRANEGERQALKNDFSYFSCGSEWVDLSHPYAYDLDLCQAKGLFPLLNRTATEGGRKALAQVLLHGNPKRGEMPAIVTDLKDRVDWRQRYLAGAEIEDAKSIDAAERFCAFSEKPALLTKVLAVALPFVAWTAVVLFQLGHLTELELMVGLMIPLVVIGSRLKLTNKLVFTGQEADVKWQSMRSRLKDIETEQFDSEALNQWKQQKSGANGTMILALNQLIRLNEFASYRMNFLVGTLLNVFFAWDLHVVLGMQKWLRTHAAQMNEWEADLHQWEVWISAANFMFNRSDLSWAELGGEEISLTGLGHPLLHEDAVKNEFAMDSACAFTIVTGPNMAGKSTFLRAVGVNLMLAHAGFPVVAGQFVFPNRKLYSSMRTADDLSEQSSYFFAELSRLRFIVDAIEQGEQVFVLLDEILKGTNSLDKERGSADFLHRLNKIGARGIIATHDLSLCRLADESKAFQNKYFDSQIEHNELRFDYKIRSGICQNMNASFLLRKMGLVDVSD
jgi:hypothetical protein